VEAVAVARAAVEGATLRIGGGGGGRGSRAAAPPRAPPRAAAAAAHAAAPPSAAAALASLRLSLDASLVTHPTGHALLPALAAAGIPHRVSRADHPLTAAGLRTLTCSRVVSGAGGGGGAGPARRRAPPGLDENAAPPDEQPIPYIIACLTAADFVALCDAAMEEEEEAGGGHGATPTPLRPQPGSAARAGLTRLAAAAAAAHPGCTLGLVIEGLDAHLTARERADVAAGRTPGRRGGGGGGGTSAPAFVRRPYDRASAIAAVHYPSLRLRLVPDAGAAAEHVTFIAAALATAHLKQAKAASFVAAFSGDTTAGVAAVAAAAAAPDAADPASKARAAAARALARLPGVPPAAAAAVAAAHGTFGGLVAWAGRAVGEQQSAAAAVAALADLRTTGGRGGRVGPAAARRVVAFVTATDGRADVEM